MKIRKLNVIITSKFATLNILVAINFTFNFRLILKISLCT